jgi:signal transduction histidine kinase
MGNYEQALFWLHEKMQSKNLIANEENAAQMNELQVKYETAQKEQRILAQELALERGILQRNLIFIFTVLFAFLSVALFFFFRYRLRLQQTITEQQSRLQQQQIQELQHRNKLVSLTAMLAGQEEERKRLAKDIHDGLGGLLATVKIQFDRVGELLKDTHAISEFHRSRNLLDETGKEVRRIAHNMMPHALIKMGLIPALEDLANNIQSANGLRVSLKCIDIMSQMSEEKEAVIYRIAQELCNNVIKHAQASKLLIQLSQHNGTYSLVVEDNGKGFIPGDPAQVGLGMESVSSRVAYLNGNLDIDPKPGKGTSVTIEFPISN